MVVMHAEIAKGAPLVAASHLEKQAGIQAVADVMSPSAVTPGERPSRYCTVAFRFTTPSSVVSAIKPVSKSLSDGARPFQASGAARLKASPSFDQIRSA
jgi:hypothetical protein